MNPAFVGYMIVAWVVLVVATFPSFPPRRGVLVVLLSGLLFLPSNLGGVVELGPIKFTRGNAICYALLLSCLLYDADRLFACTPTWADLPALAWCVCPAVTALLNDPPPDGGGAVRDAAAQALAQTTTYLIPYLIGRVYFSDQDGMRELAAGVVAAALVYVPLCLYEVRMSPRLHATVYGYMPSDFGQQVRFGGFRPVVFMSHGLAVAFFMTVATVLAAWTRGTEPAAGRWRNWAVWVLVPMLLLCKSVGWVVLTGVGLVLLRLARSAAARVGLLVLAAVPPAYCVARSTGVWDGSTLVQIAADNVNEDRSQSLGFRMEQENPLIARALERPAFGWGGWGRSRIKNEDGRDVSVTDGLWIIFMGSYGVVGLTVYGSMVLLPVVRYARRVPATVWASPPYAAASGCAVVVGLVCVDSLFNVGGADPLYLMMVGGLTQLGLAGGDGRTVARRG